MPRVFDQHSFTLCALTVGALVAVATRPTEARAESEDPAPSSANQDADRAGAEKKATGAAEGSTRTYTGFILGIAPGVATATQRMRPGFSLGFEANYGIRLYPFVIAPGVGAQLIAPPGTN